MAKIYHNNFDIPLSSLNMDANCIKSLLNFRDFG